jgi:hypothetical protein
LKEDRYRKKYIVFMTGYLDLLPTDQVCVVYPKLVWFIFMGEMRNAHKSKKT